MSRSYQDLIQISPAELRRIIERLPRLHQEETGIDRRQEARCDYRSGERLLLSVNNVNDEASVYSIVAYDLSANGFGFLHGGFIYPGVRCRLLLREHDGTIVPIAGVVVRCQLVSGRIHNLGVRFDTEIDITRFVLSSGLDAA